MSERRRVMSQVDWAPADACTLPSADRPLRVGEFAVLFAQHLAGVDELEPTHAVIHLDGDGSLADEVRDLADRETSCCSFFAFDVRRAPSGEVLLDITVPPERADVLAGMVNQARTAAESRATSAADAHRPASPRVAPIQ
ncbi:hypothetical protein [Luteipulveratus halotolerans]|nr:hypothetical protein [Luteipulveratus halotolerans]